MYLITTFLFAFSGGQYRMVSVVGYGAMAVAAGTLLVTAIVWMQRSLAAAAKTAGLALAVGWVAAVFVEWLLSLVLGGS